MALSENTKIYKLITHQTNYALSFKFHFYKDNLLFLLLSRYQILLLVPQLGAGNLQNLLGDLNSYVTCCEVSYRVGVWCGVVWCGAVRGGTV